MRRGSISGHPSAVGHADPPCSVCIPSGAVQTDARNSAGFITSAGGGAGFPNRLSSLDENCWERLISPEGGHPTSMAELLDQLDSSPEARSAALLQSLKRSRLILRRIGIDSPLNTKVELTANDLTVLTRFALTRLR